jgi:hypothetical protein
MLLLDWCIESVMLLSNSPPTTSTNSSSTWPLRDLTSLLNRSVLLKLSLSMPIWLLPLAPILLMPLELLPDLLRIEVAGLLLHCLLSMLHVDGYSPLHRTSSCFTPRCL